ncbi:MAG: hypothetical protein HFJ59_04285 [Clostridia bacterium]|nr:hypothetical protein [Clostridia bacterium]
MKRRILQAITTMSLLVVLAVGAKAGEIKTLEKSRINYTLFMGNLKLYDEDAKHVIWRMKYVKDIGETPQGELLILKEDGKCYKFLGKFYN